MVNQKANQNRDSQNREEKKIWGDFIVEKMEQLLDKEKDKDGILFYETAKEIGEKLAKSEISRTQIRKVFSEIQKKSKQKEKINAKQEVKRIEMIMAYTVGRFGNRKNEENWQSFFKIVEKAGEMVIQNRWTFENYKNFFEAIIAYHRYHGGKEQ